MGNIDRWLFTESSVESIQCIDISPLNIYLPRPTFTAYTTLNYVNIMDMFSPQIFSDEPWMGVYCALYSWGSLLLCIRPVLLSETEYGQLRIEYIY